MAPARFRSIRLVRAMLAMLALISQLTIGTLVMPDAASARSAAALDAVNILCTSMPAAGVPSHHHRHPDGTALFPLDAALALQAVLLPPSADMPPPLVLGSARPDVRPPARGPPAGLAWSLHVRGPPNPA